MEEGKWWKTGEDETSLVKAEQKMVKWPQHGETETERGVDVLLVFRVLLTLSSKQGYF